MYMLIRGREKHVYPKPDGPTDRQTYGRTLVFIEYKYDYIIVDVFCTNKINVPNILNISLFFGHGVRS